MGVLRTKRDAVVSIPCIEDCFLLSRRDRSRLVKGGWCVMCLSSGMGVQSLKIDSATRFPIFLGANDHPVAPCDGFTYWYGFNDAQSNILI